VAKHLGQIMTQALKWITYIQQQIHDKKNNNTMKCLKHFLVPSLRRGHQHQRFIYIMKIWEIKYVYIRSYIYILVYKTWCCIYVHDVIITLCTYRLCIIMYVLYICMYDGLKNKILKYLDKQMNKSKELKNNYKHKINI